MLRLVLILFATFWCWETLRYALESFTPRVFAVTRPLHPLIVALFPLLVLWPDWVAALGVAGLTGLLVGAVDRLVSSGSVVPVPLPRRRTGAGLPPLP